MAGDYPRTLPELEERFSDEQACLDYLAQVRWPNGFICPACGGDGWATERGLWMCRDCGRQTSATAGTIFHRTRTPLPLWFRAIWHVVSQKNGASAMTIQRLLGLGSYQTAWTHLHKLRRAMVRPGRDQLGGRVEVDETFIGGQNAGPRGRGAEGKALVVIAAEADGQRVGRIRMAVIDDARKATLHGFVRSAITPGSTIHTDGWRGYLGLEAIGYDHEATPMLGRDKDAATRLLPRVHRVASLLKRWLLGTHQGAIRPAHLAYYLDEFTFRFNRRTSRSRGKLFRRLLEHAVQIEPTTYRQMTDHNM